MGNVSALKEAEKELFELTQKVAALRKDQPAQEVKDYTFRSTTGAVNLYDLFGDKDQLIMIHNMGQACRYCTLWGDGINGLVSHIESVCSLVLVSKDDPEIQRRFANERGWRFNILSHGGGDYIKEQSVVAGEVNMPGIVCYQKVGTKVYRKNSAVFGPGDEFCSMWNILTLAGVSSSDWTPQYSYWKRPEHMDDGGENLQ
ncbi:DUF899 family protein [Halobacteriovorax sp. RZ-2]|uniref:DUF899 family protein n=1 Tax=unclassified Halobacteriovorax TaxID=2639665 RepID=UPI003712515B